MKTKTKLTSLAFGLMLAASSTSFAALTVNVTVDSTKMTNGYMNVFELPSNGGAYVFGSGWGIADLNAVFSNPGTVTLSPNTIGDPNPFWYTPSGGPGSVGNKIMEGNLYAQPSDGTYSGQTIVLEGIVTNFSLTSAHQAIAFIRDFAPDFSSVVEQTVPLTATGAFSVSLNTNPDPARHVQYGFQIKGPNVWNTDTAPFGNIQIAAVPEPSVSALAGLAAGLVVLRRRRA